MTSTPEPLTAAAVAAIIDHTLLRPEATAAQVAALCAEAGRLGAFSVCVSPNRVGVAVAHRQPGLAVATVCGFPSGAHETRVKAAEAAQAVADGADEVDMVINLGLVKDGDWAAVEADIAAVVQAAGDAGVKVILESAALTDDEIVAACRASVSAGAAFVKTSTGFHPAGGASVEAVELMRTTVGPWVGVKASGGIRTATDAITMIGAGASRLGCSATAEILAGLPGGGGSDGAG